MIELVDYQFGPAARRRLDESAQPGRDGAIAALESFYYALNRRDLEALTAVWSQDELAQLNNPVGGILRSGAAVTDLYRRIFAGDLCLTVTFGDAATYWWPEAVVFAGREVGQYHDHDGAVVPLTIRTTRVFGYQREAGRWLQVHHHGSIDQAEQLAQYQKAVRG
ncbi:YybH family protein [Kutzneria sp. CA-103260]|uniref:YybH family protein n=1 Tax=Kutzneria sp. CA-103260 TaxID=2802641 RepID=UPI001BA96387|nr:nuclear transport factor 2 family protein [Kutzneria sp. CA-103260]QUQ64519.1 SnoaL-like domain protein [Kutzneria sp. CA-103260]